jgi:YbbR domain-containing protein
VTRVVAFIFRNWPLKLAAILLATLLYAGLVLSQNVQVWTGRVPITSLHRPASVFILGQLGDVTNIRYVAPADVAARMTSAGFTAYVDLKDVDASSGSIVSVPVTVKYSDDRVQVFDFDPRRIPVQLDPLVTKMVPVAVDKGPLPSGVQARDPTLDVTQVAVSGPQSYVSQVTRAVARVVIQPPGISIDQSVDLVAVDGSDQDVTQVQIEPQSVRVKILVGTQLGSRALPVRAAIVGSPPAGFEVASVDVSPAAVTIEGETGALAELSEIDTAPITITGVTADVTRTVDLDIPDGFAPLGDSTVSVTVHVQPTTGSRNFGLGISITGASPDRRYSLSTDQLLVTVGGKQADLDALQGSALAGTVDVTGLGPGVHDVAVRVLLPRAISLLSVAPARVSVTITIPPTPPPTAEPTPSPTAS